MAARPVSPRASRPAGVIRPSNWTWIHLPPLPVTGEAGAREGRVAISRTSGTAIRSLRERVSRAAGIGAPLRAVVQEGFDTGSGQPCLATFVSPPGASVLLPTVRFLPRKGSPCAG